MTVSSLFDLRGQLAAYLAPHLPGCEILYSMPTVRRPLTPGVTTLVMSAHSVKRSETALPGSAPLLLEVGLRLTVLHRESMEAAELLRQAAALAQPAGLVTPLAESGRYLRELLPEYGTLGREAAELSRALEDPRFLRLVTHGVDAKSAYELTHLRELTAEAMAYGARRAREELTAAMQAGYLRPRESGLTPGAGGAFAESPEHWSRQTREELKTRARRGETIRL